MARRLVASKGIQPGTLSGTPHVKRIARRFTGLHRHGCTQCGQRYDDVCDIPDENGRCHICRGVRPALTPWETSYAPRDCCRVLSRLANENEVGDYKLGGPGPWWICTPGHGCARTHPYDPRTNQPGGSR